MVSLCNTPPASLTDLTKVGTISAEAVRERVREVALQGQVQVDVHNKPAATETEDQQDRDLSGVNNNRRFSNLSNLAQSLPGNGSIEDTNVAVSGSYDYLTSYKRGRRQNNSGNQSRLRAKDGESGEKNVRRTQSALETKSNKVEQMKKSALEEIQHQQELISSANDFVSEDEVEQPLLMKRHQSLDENRRREKNRSLALSSRSLDRHLDDTNRRKRKKLHQLAVKNEGKVLEETGNVDTASDEMINFQAELEEASEALLSASQRKST